MCAGVPGGLMLQRLVTVKPPSCGEQRDKCVTFAVLGVRGEEWICKEPERVAVLSQELNMFLISGGYFESQSFLTFDFNRFQ